MNAGETVRSVEQVQALASAVTLVRRHFPAATPNLRPWRDDAQTRQWSEPESIDLAFHFPGWSPRLQCRSLLIQLRLSSDDQERQAHLLGVLMRGMTYEGERWRLATVGDWQPAGSHLPQPDQVKQLREICQDLFELFPTDATNGTGP
ncbi:hypothetical protein [Synechococcus sp. CC9616]|uniref:hypothetical protein n=1 Tax=Synechococcus sp. CC9616 TaxID=110663 RepID=UPI00048E32FB|nr:hypothetical protein [Synechococcus sp. CC9616]